MQPWTSTDFAGPVHAHAENGYDAVAIIDERGPPITYAELERQSNALVRAWQADGITSDSVMGAMCRNHRGLVLTMLAAAKNGTKLVLMNTGFARPQLVDVAAREKVVAFVYDDEFADIADALPDDVVVYRSWPEARPLTVPRQLLSTRPSPDAPRRRCRHPRRTVASSSSPAAQRELPRVRRVATPPPLSRRRSSSTACRCAADRP